MDEKKLKRRLNTLARLLIVLVICGVTVYLYPRTGSFQYEYQKGMPWRYETLYAPFNFPIYKTDEELKSERENLAENQLLIFKRNSYIDSMQTEKFASALQTIAGSTTGYHSLEPLVGQLREIYRTGVLLLPDEWQSRADNIRHIRIIENHLATTVRFSDVYRWKKAYSTMNDAVHNAPLPKSTKEKILSLNLNNYLQPNLEFDLAKTTQSHLARLKEISLTEGIVQQGDVLISKRELVTVEKIKLLNSLKIEYQNDLGGTNAFMRTMGGQILLVLVALMIFSIYFY